MYEQIFHFSSRPFTSAPYVKHYFPGDSIHQALVQTRQSIDRASGPVVIVGAAGMGKSLLLAMLEEQYQSQFSVANLGCVRLDRRQDLLQSLLFTLNQPHQGMSEGDLRFALIDYLKPSDKCPNGVLLLVDEAHSLPVELLDEIRLITNFVREGQPRVRLVLAGNQRLEENLNDPKLQSLNQRIAARCLLTSMSRDETTRYVVDHIDRVGGKGDDLFSKESYKAIHEVSDGCPRLINQVCEHALMIAAANGLEQVNEQCVREAWADVQGIPGGWSGSEQVVANTTQLDEDDNWTVIEFGQLDDENEANGESESAEVKSDATIYEFENAPIGSDSDDDNETSESSEAEEFESEPSAWQDEDLDESSDRETFPAGDLESEGNPPSADDEHSEEASEVVESTLAEDGQLGETSDQEVGSVDSEQTSEFSAADHVEIENLANSPARGLTDEKPEWEDEEVDAAEAMKTSAKTELEPEPVFEEPTSEEAFSEESAVEQPLAEESGFEQAEAEQPVAELPSEEASDNSSLREPVETVDPFAESFVEEERLIDRFAPILAHQNQASLNVTSEDLEAIRPDEQEYNEEDLIRAFSGETDSDEEDAIENTSLDGAAAASSESAETPVVIDGELEEVDSSDLQADSGDTEAGEVADVTRVANVSPTATVPMDELIGVIGRRDEAEAARRSPKVEIIESELEEASDAWDEPGDSQQANENPVESESPIDEEITATAEDSQESTSFYTPPGFVPLVDSIFPSEQESAPGIQLTPVASIDDQDSEPEARTDDDHSEDVRQRAAEILDRLKMSHTVSHETEEGPEAATGPDPETVIESIQPPEPDAEIDQSEQILQDILEQKRILAGSRNPTETNQSPDSDSHPGDHNDDLNINLGLAPGGQAGADVKSQDDREMIVVSRMEQRVEQEAEPEPEPIPFPQTPVSTGRAERMDYQKLFDQLRDISGDE